jgi:PAS domain S-box-containing protein
MLFLRIPAMPGPALAIWLQPLVLDWPLLALMLLAAGALAFLVQRLNRSARERGLAERQFRTLFHAAPYPVVVTSVTDGGIRLANQAATDFYAITAATDFATLALPGPGANGTLATHEVTLAGRDGTRHRALASVRQVELAGESCLLHALLDVTELAQVREKLEDSLAFQAALLENSPLGIGVVRARAFTWANARLGEILASSAEQVVGQCTRSFYPDEASYERFGQVANGEVGSGRRFTGELQAVRTDGKPILVQASGQLLDHARPEKGTIWIYEDITERRAMEQALLHSKDTFHQAQKAESLTLMAGGIAHDFNNILQILQDNLELGRGLPWGSPRSERAMDRAGEALNRAAELARSLLDFSGRGFRQTEPLRLARCTEDALRALEPIRPAGIGLELEIPPSLPELEGDAGQITQVLLAFLTNGLEAMGARGSLKLRVRPWTGPAPDWVCAPVRVPELLLEIEDDGPGMDRQTLDRAFDPFFSTKSRGRGLGLPAALGILKAHGAGLSIHSAPGQGCRVTLALVAADVAAVAVPEAPAAVRPEATTVLLVDDEPLLRETIREILEEHFGLRVLEARDGQDALEVYDAHAGAIALILMDATMPRMGGIEAFEVIRGRHPGARALLCSGYSEALGNRTAEEHGFLGFLAKPYRISQLQETLTAFGVLPTPVP